MRLLLFILAFIPTASIAAVLPTMSDSRLENIAKFAVAYEKDSGAFTRSSQFVSVIKAQRSFDEIRQDIQTLRTKVGGEYSRPAHVDLEPLTILSDVEDAVYALFSYQNSFKDEEVDYWQKSWMAQIAPLPEHVETYLSIDENSFGRCRSLVFVDQKTNEVLMIGNCYSE